MLSWHWNSPEILWQQGANEAVGLEIEIFLLFLLPVSGGGPIPSPVLDEIRGALAQLVEHLHGMQGVSGSNPLRSTIFDSA